MGRIHNIEGKKNKMDSKRSAAFTKHARNITVAAKQGGALPEYKAALKLAIEKAKADNMPNDNIDRAIKKGVGGGDMENYEHITYEGYGPGGVAIIIEALTDNKNRTAGNDRHQLDKRGGNLGTAGCVSFMFDRKGALAINKEGCPLSEDEVMELVLEAGAEDFSSEDSYYEVITEPQVYSDVRSAVEEKNLEIISGEITMLPQTYQALDNDKMALMEKLLDALEDDDDVQNVYTNLEHV